MYFTNRTEAGRLLASRLQKFSRANGIVLAIPRGGVPVAYEVSKGLKLPLDIVLTRKIGHPFNKEYAIGAASLSDYFVIPHEGVSEEYIQQELKEVRQRLQSMQSRFRGQRPDAELAGKTLIIVDDGIATGNTLLATLQLLRRSAPARIVIGVPVASHQAMQKLRPLADEVVSLLVPDDFGGVGAFYEDFSQVRDEEVLGMLVERFEMPVVPDSLATE